MARMHVFPFAAVLALSMANCSKTGSSPTEPPISNTSSLGKGERAAHTSGSAAQSPSPIRLSELGREHTERLLGGDLGYLWDRMDDKFKAFVGSREAMARVLDSTLGAFEGEREIVEEEANESKNQRMYAAKVKTGDAAQWQLVWIFDGREQVAGLRVLPVSIDTAKTTEGARATAAPLELPFDGTWFVFWGGHTFEENHHVVDRAQRFAYDFVVTKEGKTFEGKGRRNEDFYCFDQPILAPAAGRVVETENRVVDNVPGKMNADRILGNHVVIDHGQGEFSFLGHLKRGSVVVKEGQQVRTGQVLGKCGNSGHSSEPHLHYHLQDRATLEDAYGYPARFRSYQVEGEGRVPLGEPVRGQAVSQTQ